MRGEVAGNQVNILVDRLDTGKWHYTTAEEQGALAKQIQGATAIPLPEARIMAYQPDPALRTWDVSNHRSYRPRVAPRP